MHLRTCIIFSFQDYYFNLNSNNLLFMTIVPLQICLCAEASSRALFTRPRQRRRRRRPVTLLRTPTTRRRPTTTRLCLVPCGARHTRAAGRWRWQSRASGCCWPPWFTFWSIPRAPLRPSVRLENVATGTAYCTSYVRSVWLVTDLDEISCQLIIRTTTCLFRIFLSCCGRQGQCMDRALLGSAVSALLSCPVGAATNARYIPPSLLD
jgi:hypothetical protein